MELLAITTAYSYAASIHFNHRRKLTGEPYVNHCCRVATICAKWHLTDPRGIVAAILHDSMMNPVVTVDDLAANFGGKVKDILTDLCLLRNPASNLWGTEVMGSTVAYLKTMKEHASYATKMIYMANLVDNARTLSSLAPSNFMRVFAPDSADLIDEIKNGATGVLRSACEKAMEELATERNRAEHILKRDNEKLGISLMEMLKKPMMILTTKSSNLYWKESWMTK